jgi:hypothetical protein
MAKNKPQRLTPLPRAQKAKSPASPADASPAAASDASRGPAVDAVDLSYIAPDLRPLAVPVDSLDFLPVNPLKHPEQQLAGLRASLKRFRQKKNIVVNTAKTPPQVVAGNGTLAAALVLGWTHVAVSREAMTDEEAAAFALVDNESARESEWDDEAVRATLAALPDLSDDPELARMMDELKAEHEVQAPAPGDESEARLDRAAEVQKKWKTAVGQTWQIGRHRVHCGDCLEIDVEPCDGVCTDPPYEMKPEILQVAIGRWAKAAVVLATGKQVFHLATNGWQHGIDFVWTHPTPRRGPAYGAGHAPLLYHVNILVMALRGHKHGWHRPAPNTSSRFEADYEDHAGHGHGKPVGLFEFMLVGFPWRTVCDPFAGSLSALLACERLGKTFVGAEMDPAMLAVGLERCADLSPQLLDS